MKALHYRLTQALVVAASVDAAATALADYPSAVAALNPVASYRLNTTNQVPHELSATNSGSLGTALNGKYVAMAASRGQPGAIVGDPDTSVSINAAAGQEITAPYSPAYNPNAPFTVELWANPADTGSGKEALVISMVNGQNASNGNDRSGWSVQKLNDYYEFVLGYDHSDGSTFYATTVDAPSGSVVVGSWTHVVAVYTPSLASLYINGTLAASLPPTFPLLPNTLAPLMMGNRGYGGWNYDGLLDEVAVYTNALSATDIQDHYNAGIGMTPGASYKQLVEADNPVLYYRLDEPALDFPVALNTGSWGPSADGACQIGSTPGLAGLQAPAAYGFETNNYAVGFDGTNGFVKTPSNPEMPSEATFVAWVKRKGVQTGYTGIVFQRGSDSTPTDVSTGLNFQGTGDALGYTWNGDPATYNYDPGLLIPDQTWTFVAGSISADKAVLYVGTSAGLQAATNAVSHQPHDFSVAPIDFGWDTTSATRIMKGEIDEVALFDKALDINAVSNLFNAALPAILGISRSPADPVYAGLTVTYSAAVAAPSTPTYQWQKNGAPIAGQTGPSLVLDAVNPNSTGDYSLIAQAGGVSLTSAPLQLAIVSSAPVLTQSPVSILRELNGQAGFSVAAVGTQPITYQWSHGSTAIGGATNATLLLPDLQTTDAGTYSVVVTNPLGTASASATLSLASLTAYGKTAIDGGPIGYWPLNETTGSTAFDLWGGRDGVVDPAVTVGVSDLTPPAFQGLPTSNTVYQLANGGAVTVPALNLNNNTMTIATWIKPMATEPDYAGLVFSRTANTVSGLDYNTGGQIGYHWNNTSATYSWASGLFPVSNAWNFVALVIEPDQGTVYLDSGSGLQSAVNQVSNAGSPFEGALKFGLDDNGGGRSFTGLMGPVAVFGRSLSMSEITALRNAGINGQYNGPVPVTFLRSPASQTLTVGDSYTLAAKIAGSPPISFQWQKDGTNLPGAVRSTLTLPSAATTDSGTYKLVATQGATPVTSASAVIQVNPTPQYLNATNGLVLHLKFDGDYSDATGRGNDGSPVGSPVIIPGKIGTGALKYSTDAANMIYNYVTLGTPADLNFGTDTDFTVAYWISFTGAPGDLPFLGNAVNSTYNPGLVFADSYQLGGWSFTADDGTTTIAPTGPNNSINDGKWHSLVHVFARASNVTTYLDGVLVDTTSIVGLGSLDTGNAYIIGQDPTGAYGQSATESMDDLGIWQRALTQYEAESIHAVGQFGRSFDSVAPAAVVLAIQFGVGGNLSLQYASGALQSAPSINGPWANVPNANAPATTVTPTAGNVFYRVLTN